MKNEARTASPRQSDVSQPKENLPPRLEEPDGIRIRSISTEGKECQAEKRKHDYSEVQKILSHLKVTLLD